MLKLRAGKLVLLGLTAKDCLALAQGKPVLIDVDELGLDVNVALIYGENHDRLLERVAGLGIQIGSLQTTSTGTQCAVSNVSSSAVLQAMCKLSAEYLGVEPMPPQPCVHCGRTGIGSKALGSDQPARVGDWCICFGCGGVMRMGEGLRMRAATAADMAEMSELERRTLDATQGAIWARNVEGQAPQGQA